MIKLPITTKQTYQVPAMSVVVITLEHNFLKSAISDLDPNPVYEEDFED